MARIGVLALQGDFREHHEALRRLSVLAREVRIPRELDGLDGVIIPGGESTAIALLLRTSNLLEPLKDLAAGGFPIWGTCAGMILLAKRLDATGIPTLEAMDIGVRRNAFGRQLDSFEADLHVPVFGDPPYRAIFIRAPIIEEVGSAVEVLTRLPDGSAVAARQGRLLATAFHPELTGDLRFHRYFIENVAASP